MDEITDGPRTRDDAGTRGSRGRAALILFALVVAASLFGIYTRPIGFLANLWPANAIMLAFLLRVPAGRTWQGWLAGAVAYLAADLLTGASLPKALLLNSANLAGIATAAAIYARRPADMIRLRQPASMLFLVLTVAAGAAVAGVIGAVANPWLFGRQLLSGWSFWFATEFVNYVTILPLLLAAPSFGALPGAMREGLRALPTAGILPIVALALSCLLAAIVGGPGAIAFPVPALLWCGLTYRVFTVAILTLLYGNWALIVLASRTGVDAEMMMISIRLGAALVAIAPVTVACIAENRNELLGRLRHIAAHDHLTGTRARGAFLDDVQTSLANARAPAAILMIDIDHFKAINDNHGHAAGDRLLQSFAGRVRSCLRDGDHFGRMGGEEFAIFLPATNRAVASRIAAGILGALRDDPFEVDDDRAITLTASIGIALIDGSSPLAPESLFAAADAALYRAKGAGRDRIEVARHDPVALAG